MAVAPCIVCLRIAPVRRGRFSAHRNSKPNKSCIMKKIFTLLAFAACCAAAAWSCSDEYEVPFAELPRDDCVVAPCFGLGLVFV